MRGRGGDGKFFLGWESGGGRLLNSTLTIIVIILVIIVTGGDENKKPQCSPLPLMSWDVTIISL